MASPLQDLKELLLEWDSHALLVSKAIESRDFEAYSQANIEGRKCFERMARIIAAMDKADLRLCRAEIDQCVSSWQRNIEAMPEWMKETKDELQRVGKQLSVQRKLGKAYSDSSKPSRQGRNLMLKIK